MEKGVWFLKIDPADTSKMCSSCGTITDLKLGEQIFECPACGLILDRDYNASLNIKRLATQSLGEIPKSPKGSVDVQSSVPFVRKGTDEKRQSRTSKKQRKTKARKDQTIKNDKRIDKEITEKLIIYILANYEDKTRLTEKVLRSLVYHCDFNYHRLYGETMTKSRYTETKRRLLNPELSSIMRNLLKNRIIKKNFYTSFDGRLKNYLTSAFPFCPSAFTEKQRQVIDETIRQHISSGR